MNPNRDLKPTESLAHGLAEGEPAQGEPAELAKLMEEVAEDALRRSDTYLQETVVPEGGE